MKENVEILNQFKNLCLEEWPRDKDIGTDDDNFYMAYIIIDHEKVVGGAILHEISMFPCQYWLFLSFLLIHPDKRSQGVGTELIDLCKDKVRLLDNEIKEYRNKHPYQCNFDIDVIVGSEGDNSPTTFSPIYYAEGCQLALYAEQWNDKTRKFYEHRGFKFLEEEDDVYEDHNGIACVYSWIPEKSLNF